MISDTYGSDGYFRLFLYHLSFKISLTKNKIASIIPTSLINAVEFLLYNLLIN